jgi:predicted unusual protein kinase regulating ubiquinone biosynthesis (AarF/ABC1/UbiB family)
MNLYRRMDASLDHEEVYAEIAERMREELDYLREAAQMRLYGIMLDGVPACACRRRWRSCARAGC